MTTSFKNIIEPDFERLYVQLRKKEGRMYTDEELINLPDIDDKHQYYKEWQLRKLSSQKLTDHLKKKNRPLDILEIGCGNGWLCHRLATIPESRVIGTDINFTEVQQAARVFYFKPNLHFIYGYADSGLFEDKQFDIIIFAASIQYFNSLHKILWNAFRLLKSKGSIHIIDSPFYTLSEVGSASKRSYMYYEALGFPEMMNYYFHHKLEDLEHYDHTLLHDPNSLFNKFVKNNNPFPWICIKT